jgi:hypothetical protein
MNSAHRDGSSPQKKIHHNIGRKPGDIATIYSGFGQKIMCFPMLRKLCGETLFLRFFYRNV